MQRIQGPASVVGFRNYNDFSRNLKPEKYRFSLWAWSRRVAYKPCTRAACWQKQAGMCWQSKTVQFGCIRDILGVILG